MSGDDPIEDGMAVAMTGAATMSRVAEILIRQAQEAKARKAAATRENAEELRQQLAARADMAEAFFGAAAEEARLARAATDEVAAAVHGVHAWAEVDPDRFGEQAERMRRQVEASFGVDLREAYEEQRGAEAIAELARVGLEEARDSEGAAAARIAKTGRVPEVAAYDAPENRDARGRAMREAGVPQVAVKARTVADQLNAHDPRGTAAAVAAGKGKGPKKAAVRSSRRHHGQQRGR